MNRPLSAVGILPDGLGWKHLHRLSRLCVQWTPYTADSAHAHGAQLPPQTRGTTWAAPVAFERCIRSLPGTVRPTSAWYELATWVTGKQLPR